MADQAGDRTGTLFRSLRMFFYLTALYYYYFRTESKRASEGHDMEHQYGVTITIIFLLSLLLSVP